MIKFYFIESNLRSFPCLTNIYMIRLTNRVCIILKLIQVIQKDFHIIYLFIYFQTIIFNLSHFVILRVLSYTI